MKHLLTLILFLVLSGTAFCFNNNVKVDTLPYYQIPDYPETYTAPNVTARMIDGLGYRYYWATEGLREEDRAYDPGNGGKIASEVLEHLLGLSRFTLRTIKGEAHSGQEYPDLSWEEQRETTLNNFKEASDILKSLGDISDLNFMFKRGEQTNELPFWHAINGPIADAIYHTGQIVSYRRSTGNPSNSGVNVFMGKTRQ